MAVVICDMEHATCPHCRRNMMQGMVFSAVEDMELQCPYCRGTSFFNMRKLGFQPHLPPYRGNQELARRLLYEAGWDPDLASGVNPEAIEVAAATGMLDTIPPGRVLPLPTEYTKRPPSKVPASGSSARLYG